MQCVYADDDDYYKCPKSVSKDGSCSRSRSKAHICACSVSTTAATTTIAATTTAAATTTKAALARSACVRACALVGYTQRVRVRVDAGLGLG